MTEETTPATDLQVDDAEIVAALEEQRGFVRHLLGSRRWETEDVMAQVALDLVASLPRWRAADPRPSLGAWARGVAVRTFYAWLRSPGAGRGPGGTQLVSADALAEAGVAVQPRLAPPAPAEVADGQRELVTRLRQAVLAQPGGAARWAAMVGEDGRVRGQRATATLRLLLEIVDPDGTLRAVAGCRHGGTWVPTGATDAA